MIPSVGPEADRELSDASKKYATTWFDLFRIVDGKIAEHWDPAVK
jgi:predicted SnoaL-like aldol condensation-catalyzing enzyme